ncbi:LysR family transcriptional regulator [Mesorhizobium erdmanii]|uniref:LysR family transcriptional regulator n=1 Tax=Mesorhizobium erdmanii TaxID=1777866 RepID=A0A6M7UIE2_9HYPH|nr:MULTISPECIES: LysR family transcriptional regulator [Mesorhizobium]OBQ73737.1 transcriptional regulator [Mesorhizobium loti]QKC75873.1 LysR family transcriptional regulator [Mesorhizobium erdmanii]
MDRLAAMSTFIRVVETGSFSAAARHLRVGQPAVSKAIAQLEERLGVRLLSRTTRGLSPTDAGVGFYEGAKRAVDEADEAENTARGASAALTGLLRIGTSVTFGRLHVVPRLKTFLDAHPKLNVEVAMDDRNVDLVEEGVDVMLRLGESFAPAQIGRKIATCRRLVIAAPSYLAREGEPIAPDELSRHEAILFVRAGTSNRWTFQRGAEEVSLAGQGRLRVTSAEGIREAVLAGIGFTVGSEWMFEEELRSGVVRPILVDWALPPVELWALFPAGRKASARARTFVDFLAGSL